MKRKIKQYLARRKQRREPEKSLEEAIHNIPRITNETVAEHREEVLSSARKYIYPLQHSMHRIVMVSASIFVVLIVVFFVYSVLALYRFNATSTFIYRVTQVLPFPVAKAGSNFVSYENYLFELRHYVHYYQNQQKVDFTSASGQQQLAAFRKTALESVINDSYIKELAQKNKIAVTEQELTNEIELLRSQNRLGSSNAVFQDVLKEFWGWSLNDFKRELKAQMLAQKVVSALDTETHDRAQNVLTQLNNGGDFAAIAKQFSEDPGTKDNGGDYGAAIEKTNRDLPPKAVDALLKLEPGQISGIVETPLGLEVLKVREKNGNTVRASHIYFLFKDVNSYLDPIKKQQKPRNFIRP